MAMILPVSNVRPGAAIGWFLLTGIASASACGEEVMLFDFREDTHGWHGNPRIEDFRQDPETGLVFDSVGHDPWIEGPSPQNLPLGEKLRLTIRMRSTGDRAGEVFYGEGFDAARRVGFLVRPDGEWHDYEVVIPPQEQGSRLRIDPAAGEGTFAVQWIAAEPLIPMADIYLPSPELMEFSGDAHVTEAGGVSVRHDGHQWNGFEVLVYGEPMAASLVNERIGYVVDGESAFLELRDAVVSLHRSGLGLTVEARLEDRHGARWKWRRVFRPHFMDLGLEVETTVEVDRDRAVFHLPWVTLFPGLGAFGERKSQAVLPGVEYLGEDEASSSERSFEGDQAVRRIVEDYKLTSTFMALSYQDRYFGLAWDREDRPAPVFDSPDRLHDSGAHLMALWHPGVGAARLENEVNPMMPVGLEANIPRTLTVQLFGGRDNTVAAAARHYALYNGGLPEVPEFAGGVQSAIRLLAAGWLDSDGYDDGLWRHAVWPGFGPQATAEAPAQMLWLAEHTDDGALARRLRSAAERGLERLNPESCYGEAIGHVNRPVAPLLFGRIDRYIEERVAEARRSLEAFDGEGLRQYVPPEDGPDYGRTHWADHANGYGFAALEPLLEAAAFSGEETLIEQVLAVLDKQAAHYGGTVPRGAQTWEMPLHTPDILASARMVRSYVLGYKLTGDDRYLDEARYWAWTGVPLVYLDNPTAGSIGPYATIAVLGATNWVAPNWIGQPVQWCGLVYRSALHELARVDERKGPFWDRLARGITASGLQQTFPMDDPERQGLLADFTLLKSQIPDGPAITPGTVQTHVAELFGLTPWFECRRVTADGVLAFLPGGITAVKHEESVLRLVIDAWPGNEFTIRLSRLPHEPESVTWNGEPAGVDFDPALMGANISVEGSGTLAIEGI